MLPANNPDRSTIDFPGHACSRKPSILLADEQTLMLVGLQKLLEPHFDVLGILNNGHDLVRQAKALRPKIVLTEIPLRGIGGIEAAQELRSLKSNTKVIFVTERAETSYVHQALRAGASGYILKRCTSEELQMAIHRVLAGHMYLTPELQNSVDRDNRSFPVDSAVSGLTHREREVLKLVVQGHSARTISAVLHISEKTVAFHKHNLRCKLSLRTAAEMATFVSQNSHILSAPEEKLPNIA